MLSLLTLSIPLQSFLRSWVENLDVKLQCGYESSIAMARKEIKENHSPILYGPTEWVGSWNQKKQLKLLFEAIGGPILRIPGLQNSTIFVFDRLRITQ